MLIWGLLAIPVSLAAQEKHPKSKRQSLSWNPPEIDSKLKSLLPEPACILPNVLQRAGKGAYTLYRSLNSFTAREDIQYLSPHSSLTTFDNTAALDFSYDYQVFYKLFKDGITVRDGRKLLLGVPSRVGIEREVGLPGQALIFMPEIQPDYEFSCEGTVLWNGKPAWVVHFQQRKDRPMRTIAFYGGYQARLQGRAWIAPESGEIEHLEAGLMNAVLQANIQYLYLSINYAPVLLSPMKTRKLLPMDVEIYSENGDQRTVRRYAYSAFKLFASTVKLLPYEPEAHNP